MRQGQKAIAANITLVLEIKIVVTIGVVEQTRLEGGFLGTGYVLFLDLGAGYLMCCLCENISPFCVHFSVCLVHFNKKFPPKSICGLREANRD